MSTSILRYTYTHVYITYILGTPPVLLKTNQCTDRTTKLSTVLLPGTTPTHYTHPDYRYAYPYPYTHPSTARLRTHGVRSTPCVRSALVHDPPGCLSARVSIRPGVYPPGPYPPGCLSARVSIRPVPIRPGGGNSTSNHYPPQLYTRCIPPCYHVQGPTTLTVPWYLGSTSHVLHPYKYDPR
jgi:hypothetical protein